MYSKNVHDLLTFQPFIFFIHHHFFVSLTSHSLSLCLSLFPSPLQSLASMTSTPVKVNRALSVPSMPFDLPLVANPKASVTIAPPSAHIGPAPRPDEAHLLRPPRRTGNLNKYYDTTTTLLHQGSQLCVFFFNQNSCLHVCIVCIILPP